MVCFAVFSCCLLFQVIEETLRLFGPVGGPSKEAPEGGLTLSGYHIPEGTGISVGFVGPLSFMWEIYIFFVVRP